jgi:hypothetical protein
VKNPVVRELSPEKLMLLGCDDPLRFPVEETETTHNLKKV